MAEVKGSSLQSPQALAREFHLDKSQTAQLAAIMKQGLTREEVEHLFMASGNVPQSSQNPAKGSGDDEFHREDNFRQAVRGAFEIRQVHNALARHDAASLKTIIAQGDADGSLTAAVRSLTNKDLAKLTSLVDSNTRGRIAARLASDDTQHFRLSRETRSALAAALKESGHEYAIPAFNKRFP